MNPRTTAVLALVAAAFGAFIYFHEIRGGEERQAAEEAGKRLFAGIEPADVQWIVLRTPLAETVRLERSAATEEAGAGQWRVVDPVDFPADDATGEQLASSLATLPSVAVLEDAKAPGIYGLDEDARIVRFGNTQAEYVLRIGDATPVGANVYARAGEGPVVTIANWRVTGFEKSLNQLRDREILDFDRARVDGITLRWPGGGVVLAKADDPAPGAAQWKLTAPLETPADDEAVDDLLSELSFLRAEGFVDEVPAEGDPYALDAPYLDVELRMSALDELPARQLRMTIGATPVTGELLAVRASQPQLYQVPRSRLDIPRDVTSYRFRELAGFEISEAAAFELTLRAQDGSSSLELRGTRDEGDWRVEPQDMKPDLAGGLVAEVAPLKATEIAAEGIGAAELAALGLQPPRTHVRVLGDAPDDAGEAPVLAEFSLGRIDPQRGIPATLPGRETLFFVDAALAQWVPIGLEAFDARFAAPPEAQASPTEAAEPLASSDEAEED